MIPVRNLYYLLCYAWDSLEEADTVDAEELDGFDRIEDLFGTVLARGVTRLARRGIDRNYVPFEEELPGIRGKIEMAATIRRTSLLRQRVVCSFEELSPDVVHNQILASTLDVVIRHGPLDVGVRNEVRLAASRLGGVSIVPLTGRLFARVQLDRNRRAYRFLLSVCRLLFDTHLVSQVSGESRFAGLDVERLVMWRVFELFAERFYEREQQTYQVSSQSNVAWWDLETRGPLSEGRIPRMIPDLILDGSERRIVLDTKFYKHGGLGSEENAKLHAGNLYQLFAYVMNRERSQPEGPLHEGILLYPTVGEEVRVDFSTHGHRFQARSVDLGRPWREIYEAMLGVLV